MDKKLFKRQFFKYLALILVLCAVSYYFIRPNEKDYADGSTIFSTMSTTCSIRIITKKEKFESSLNELRDTVKSVEKLCNKFNPESELSKLNSSAYDAPFHCSDALWEILTEARKFHKLTDGAFDITIDPLMKLWGFNRKEKRLPSPAEIADALKSVGLDKVVFDDSKHTVRFTVPGMSLNLGGIAKGWAIDRATKKAGEIGVQYGFLDLGGNTMALDPFPGKTNFSAGVRNPFRHDEIAATTLMKREAIATSGNYERYVLIDGKQYTHIMNPQTGLPVSDRISVSVITPRGVDSDALSTSIFILGADFARKIVKEFPRTRVLIYQRKPGTREIEAIALGDSWRYQQIQEPPPVAPGTPLMPVIKK